MSFEPDRIRPEVLALAERGNVTLAEWKEFRGNSWEQQLIIPKLDDEAFAFCAEYVVANCCYDRSQPFQSYNDILPGLIVPEMVRRLRARGSESALVKVTEFDGQHIKNRFAVDIPGDPAPVKLVLFDLVPDEARAHRGTWRITVEFTPESK